MRLVFGPFLTYIIYFFYNLCTKEIKTRHCKKVYSRACEGDRGGNVFHSGVNCLNHQNHTSEISPTKLKVKVENCV